MFEIFHFCICLTFYIVVAAVVSSTVLCSKKKNNASTTVSGKNDLKFDIQNDAAPETELKSDADANLLGDKKIQCKIMPGCQDAQAHKKGVNGHKTDCSQFIMVKGEKPLAVRSELCVPK